MRMEKARWGCALSDPGLRPGGCGGDVPSVRPGLPPVAKMGCVCMEPRSRSVTEREGPRWAPEFWVSVCGQGKGN